jgi:hypothetical protein
MMEKRGLRHFPKKYFVNANSNRCRKLMKAMRHISKSILWMASMLVMSLTVSSCEPGQVVEPMLTVTKASVPTATSMPPTNTAVPAATSIPPANTPAPIPDSLEQEIVAHYPFNGDANDVSGHGYHGVVNGVDLAADRFGDPNKAYGFDGEWDYIEIPDIGTYNQLTESLWVYYKGTPYIAVLNCHKEWSANYLHFEITGNRVEFAIHGKNSDQYSDFIFDSRTLNQWHHIAVTYDSATGKIQFYIDGILDAVKQYDVPRTVTVGPAWIGGWNGESRRFLGSLDDIRIYNRVLSASEIQTLYQGQ